MISLSQKIWHYVRNRLWTWRYHLYRRNHREEILTLTLKAIYESTFQYRATLLRMRKTEAYNQVFGQQEPLVSIRVPTHNRAHILAERAISSIRAQTYKNIEVIVVGDNCTDDTEGVIKRIGDNRITFVTLPDRGPCPEDKTDYWRVVGTAAANLATSLAKGDWICPLDDDDEFYPTHVEDLLRFALQGKFEFAYGKVNIIKNNILLEKTCGAFPPRMGTCPMQASIYLRLLGFVEYDRNAWLFEEPGDWNLVRRLVEIGVRIGFLDKIVGAVYQEDHRFRQSRAENA